MGMGVRETEREREISRLGLSKVKRANEYAG